MGRRYVRDRIGRFAKTAGKAAASAKKRGAQANRIRKIAGAQAHITIGDGKPKASVSVGRGKFRKTVYETGKGSGASGSASRNIKGRAARAGSGLKSVKRTVTNGAKRGATLGLVDPNQVNVKQLKRLKG